MALMATFDGLGATRKNGSKPRVSRRRVCGCRLTQVRGGKAGPQPIVKCPGVGAYFVSRRVAAQIERKTGGSEFCYAAPVPTRRGKPCSRKVRQAVKLWCGIDPGKE